jgi:RimJ/RimL family protein N-acetyltransferase
MVEADYEPLFAAASDPLIWAQHPDHLRYTRERFDVYFRGGIESRGALVVADQRTGAIIGSSRYAGHDPALSTVEVGWTFLTRPFWGGGTNRELKTLMLDHAFAVVDGVLFFVGDTNIRSQRAMKKIGGVEIRRETVAERNSGATSVVFLIAKSQWLARNS